MKITDDPWYEMSAGDVKYYKTRLVSGGVYVPVSVWFNDGIRDSEGNLISDQIIGATIDNAITTDINYISKIYPFFTPITESEYQYMSDLSSWSKTDDSNSPIANPDEKINFNTMELPF